MPPKFPSRGPVAKQRAAHSEAVCTQQAGEKLASTGDTGGVYVAQSVKASCWKKTGVWPFRSPSKRRFASVTLAPSRAPRAPAAEASSSAAAAARTVAGLAHPARQRCVIHAGA